MCSGDPALLSLTHAFCSLLLPVGHTMTKGVLGGRYWGPGGLPEAERSRINHEDLLKKATRFLLIHITSSLILLVPYYTFLELFLHTSPSTYLTSPLLLSRPLTHSLPPVLLLLTAVFFFLYHREARRSRDAARTWTEIASPQPAFSPVAHGDQPPTSPILPPPSPSRPMRPGDILSAHISRDGHPPPPASLPALVYPALPSAPQPAPAPLTALPPGCRKCGHQDCVTCAFLLEGYTFASTATGRQYRFMTPVTCTDSRIIYLVTCKSCRYIFNYFLQLLTTAQETVCW